MNDERLSMERHAVESMQGNLDRGEPAILASYGLIGAILLLGGIGFLADPQRQNGALFPEACRRHGLDIVRTSSVPIDFGEKKQTIDLYELGTV